MVKAAVYTRISNDPEGLRAGVDRQEADCRAYCERKGWEPFEVYVDNDVSAWARKPRPAYRRMLADLKAGRVGAVVCWHLDRLHRQPKELEEFFEVVDASGAELGTCFGDYDLATTDGQFMARLLAAVAKKESDDKSRRQRRKNLELAEQGQLTGGGTRPFGYEQDRLTVREAEAELVREAARRVLAGESVRSIVVDWERRGIQPVTGGPWSTRVFARMLTSGRIAGLREHHGQVVADAAWPAIIDRETHEELRAVLNDPRRRTSERSFVRTYLLTGGLSVCGLCGTKLVAQPASKIRKRAYVCSSGPNFRGCGRMGINADRFEEIVKEAVIISLSSPQMSASLQAAQDEGAESTAGATARELVVLEERLERLKRAHFVEGDIDAGDYRRLRAELERKIDDRRAAVADRTGQRALEGIPSAEHDLRAWWDAEDTNLDQKRAVIMAIIERFIVNTAASRGSHKFDPDRVEIVWRA